MDAAVKTMETVSDVLRRAADRLESGWCRGANARTKDGKVCSVFSPRAASYSMYGALCAVLGPGLGDDKALQASSAWRLITLRAWYAIENLPSADHTRAEYALHDLNDNMRQSVTVVDLFRKWAEEDDIKALGEWK